MTSGFFRGVLLEIIMFRIIQWLESIIAGNPVSIALRYTHEGEPLQANARLRIGYREKDGAGTLQFSNPQIPNYLSLSTSAEVDLQIDDNIRRYRSITFFSGTGQSDMVVISICVASGCLQAGDSVDIVLGNPKNEKGHFLVGNFADTPLEFFFSIDSDNAFAPKLLHPNAPNYEQFISDDGKTYPDWKSKIGRAHV